MVPMAATGWWPERAAAAVAVGVPLAAVLAAGCTWLVVPTADLALLIQEGGPIETFTVWGYLAAGVAMVLALPVARHKANWVAALVVLACFAARELDWHVQLTGTSVLRLSYYLKGPFTGVKALALAIVLLGIASALVLARHAWAGLRGRRPREGSDVIAVGFFATLLIGKVFDRTVSILRDDFGVAVPRPVRVLIRSVEEFAELALPLMVLAGLAIVVAQALRGTGNDPAA